MFSRFLGSEQEIKDYIKSNHIKSAVELADKRLENYLNSKENKKFKKRIDSWLDILDKDIREKYFEVYKRNFKLPKLLNDYYNPEILTESAVKRAMILQHGRNFEDGFSGVKVKNNCYTNDYVIEVVDGEKGQVFCKKYRGSLPTIEQILVDSVFGLGDLDVREQGNLYSIVDFFA